MKKIALSLALSTLVLGGLVGCGQTGTQSLNNDGYRFANDTTNRSLDNRYYGDGIRMYNNRDSDYNFQRYGGNAPINGQDVRSRDNRMGMGDRNYGVTGDRPGMVDDRGLLRDHNRGMTSNYHHNYNGTLAQKIAKSVESMNGVRDTRVIVSGNDVVIGIESTNGQQRDMEKRVQSHVKNMVKNKNVYVVTDQERFSRIRSVDDRLRNGTPFEEVGDTVTDMVRDIGSAVERPFENFR